MLLMQKQTGFLRRYRSSQRRKIEALPSLNLTQANREKRTLEEIMSDISQAAQKRGLTPKILDFILHED